MLKGSLKILPREKRMLEQSCFSRKTLGDYLRGRLSDKKRKDVEDHIFNSECQNCDGLLKYYLWSWLPEKERIRRFGYTVSIRFEIPYERAEKLRRILIKKT